MNVPDDWGAYYRQCLRCGTRYHESEGGCDCEADVRDLLEDAIMREVDPDTAGHVAVLQGGYVVLDYDLSARCGLDRWDGDIAGTERKVLCRVMAAMTRGGDRCGIPFDLLSSTEDGEETVDSYDGEQWMCGIENWAGADG